MPFHPDNDLAGRASLRRGGFILISIFTLHFSGSASADPAWWTTRSVTTNNAIISDYSPVLIGQLKWMATNAQAELAANLTGGAGSNLTALVTNFAYVSNAPVANIGQLKYVASFVYMRLTNEGYTSTYPWTVTTTDDVDYALANIGQLKNLFNFDITIDTDTDSLYDWWEVRYWGAITNQAGMNDFESDGLNNIAEYANHASPTNSDTDADGYTDGFEVSEGTAPDNAGVIPLGNISGSILYGGSQTGTIRIVAVLASNSWVLTYTTTLAATGVYSIASIPKLTNYWIRAFRDPNGNETWDSATEPYGVYASNPLFLSNNVSNAHITLNDPDDDGDGLINLVETGTGIYIGPANSGSSSTNANTDGDVFDDGVEVANRTDPNNSETNKPVINLLLPVNNSVRILMP